MEEKGWNKQIFTANVISYALIRDFHYSDNHSNNFLVTSHTKKQMGCMIADF